MRRKFISKNGFCLFAAISMIALTQSGCTGNFVLVQSNAIETTKSGNLAEVTVTPRYSKMVSQIKSVALNAPSSCANKSASEVTGAAEGKGDVVKTLCGVEMAEIERALVRQGYTVYSWNMLNNLIGTNMTAIEGAKKLGAQVLFQVNSLERVKLSPGRDVRLEHGFFESTKYGDRLGAVGFDENRISNLKDVIGANEIKQLSFAKRLGAMLDISAIDTETHQTIWFYRWNNQEDTSKNAIARYLVECNWRGCNPKDIESHDDEKVKSSEKRSSGVENLSIDARPASEQDAIYFGLLRDVTADFVKRFSLGQ
ncbi:MAG: hypothetical protein WC581_02420 [Thermodesulfovibrionales bacterium]